MRTRRRARGGGGGGGEVGGRGRGTGEGGCTYDCSVAERHSGSWSLIADRCSLFTSRKLEGEGKGGGGGEGERAPEGGIKRATTRRSSERAFEHSSVRLSDHSTIRHSPT